jgi:hypothetical protein
MGIVFRVNMHIKNEKKTEWGKNMIIFGPLFVHSEDTKKEKNILLEFFKVMFPNTISIGLFTIGIGMVLPLQTIELTLGENLLKIFIGYWSVIEWYKMSHHPEVYSIWGDKNDNKKQV